MITRSAVEPTKSESGSESVSRILQARRTPTPLRSTPIAMPTTSTTTSSQPARLTTERDALEAQVTAFKRSLELVQVEGTQLVTQLSNWQHLKKEEDADAEEAKKNKLELEQGLEAARRRISEFEARAGETEALKAKIQEQTDGAEILMRRWMQLAQSRKVDAQEQSAARETAETRLTDAQVQITTLEQKIIELQAQLSATSVFNNHQSWGTKKASPPPPKKSQANSSQPKEDSEDTVGAVPRKRKRKI